MFRRLARPLLGLILLGSLPGLCLLATGNPGSETIPGPSPFRAAAYDQPVVDAQSVRVEGLSIAIGHMDLKLAKGRASIVKVAGKPAGLFFSGEGKARYLSTDPTEHPVLKFNLKRNTSLEARALPGGLEVEDAVKSVLIWYGGMPLPALEGAAAEGLADEFKEQRTYFSFRNWAQVGNSMALREGNAPERHLAIAEIAGKNHKGVFVYDDALSRKESYSATQWRETTGAPAINQIPLSESFLLGSRNNPLDPDFLLTAVDLTLQASSGSFAKIQVTETVVPVKPSLRMLQFQLNSNNYPWDGSQFRPSPIRVESVLTEAGEPVAFEHHDDVLCLSWPTALQPSQPIKLKFVISGKMLLRHGGDNYWELGIEPWFPQPEVTGQAYTVHCRMEVEKPFLPVAPGKVLKQETTETHHILETVIERPVCFLALAAGKFETMELTSPNTSVKVRLYGYAGLSKASGERLARTVQGFIQFYQTFLGKFPFDDLVIIERNELGHGQAPPGTVFITSEAFNPLSDDVTRIYASAWINQGVAHEVAHQYWGIKVRMFDHDDQWISEAFSEYCAALAMRQIKSTGKDRFSRAFARWTSQAKTANESTDISHANWLHSKEPGERWYRQFIMYDKGALMLGALHKELGEDGFARFLSTYQGEFAWRATITQDIPDLLKRLTGKNWEPFFKKYYSGTELPEAHP